MAGKKTITEIVDAIVIALFIIIFVLFMQPFISLITGTPAYNNLGNFMLIAQEAYNGYDARYPLIVTEQNDYNVFGQEIYLTQFRNYQANKEDTVMGESVAASRITQNCDPQNNCICLINMLNCIDAECEDDLGGFYRRSCDPGEYVDDSIPTSKDAQGKTTHCCIKHQTKWELLFEQNNLDTSSLLTLNSGGEQQKEDDDELKILTLNSGGNTFLKDYTQKMLEESSCDATDLVYVRVMSCKQIIDSIDDDVETSQVRLEHDNRPIILFPKDVIKTDAEIVEIKLRKQDETIDFETIIMIDTKWTEKE